MTCCYRTTLEVCEVASAVISQWPGHVCLGVEDNEAKPVRLLQRVNYNLETVLAVCLWCESRAPRTYSSVCVVNLCELHFAGREVRLHAAWCGAARDRGSLQIERVES